MSGVPAVLRPGDQVPHFVVGTISGVEEAYSRIWQRRNLLLVCVPAGDAAFDPYVSSLLERTAAFGTEETACVITSDAVPGVPMPGVVVADRWGEVFQVVPFRVPRQAPGAAELLETVAHVRMKCPECEGEAK